MSLKNDIESLKAKFLPQIPDKIKASMRKAQDDLRKLRLAERALGTGDIAVDFTLPNAMTTPAARWRRNTCATMTLR